MLPIGAWNKVKPQAPNLPCTAPLSPIGAWSRKGCEIGAQMTNEREKMRTHSTPPTPLFFVSGYFALRFSLHRPDPFVMADIYLSLRLRERTPLQSRET